MKMAKPSGLDIQAAEELLQILQLIDARFGGPWGIPEATHALAAGNLQRVKGANVGAQVLRLRVVHLVNADGDWVVVGSEVRLTSGLEEVALGGAAVPGEQITP